MLGLIFLTYTVASSITVMVMSFFETPSIGGGAPPTSSVIWQWIDYVVYLISYVLVFAVPLIIWFAFKNNEKTTDYFYINRKPSFSLTVMGCTIILAINYFCVIFEEFGGIIFGKIGILSSFVPEIGDDLVSNVLYFIILVVAPAVLEEFCYRGVICGRLARYNRTAAVLVSAILFSLMHQSLDQIPFAFLAGLLLGYLYLRTKSIWTCVIIHAANNGFAYAQEYLYANNENIVLEYMGMWAFIFFVGWCAVLYMGLTHERAENQPLSTKEALSLELTSPVILIFCAVTITATVLALVM